VGLGEQADETKEKTLFFLERRHLGILAQSGQGRNFKSNEATVLPSSYVNGELKNH